MAGGHEVYKTKQKHAERSRKDPVHNHLEMIIQLPPKCSMKYCETSVLDFDKDATPHMYIIINWINSLSPCPADKLEPSTILHPSDKRFAGISGISEVVMSFPTPQISTSALWPSPNTCGACIKSHGANLGLLSLGPWPHLPSQ